MSNLICDITKILELTNIPNADRIELAKVKGFHCIVGKGQFKVGDLVLYIPVDSIIPQDIVEQFKLEFLKKGGRVECIKMKGVFSEGLILPNFKSWQEGINVAQELGIQKYELAQPPAFQRTGIQPTKKRLNVRFDVYTDIQNLKHFPEVFQTGDDVVITEKIHGTNVRYGYLSKNMLNIWDFISSLWGKYEFVYGSHRVQLKGIKKNSYYGEDIYGKVADVYCMYEKCKLFPDYIFYGEIFGPKIQNLTYDQTSLKLQIFDIKNTKTNKYLDWEQVKLICYRIALETVPELHKGTYSPNVLNVCTNGKSTIANHLREGCVVKSAKETVHPFIGRKILKSINSDYLLLKDRTDAH